MTTAALARAVGVTEPILYRHFRSKKLLYRELLAATAERVTSQLECISADAKDLVDALRRMCLGYPELALRFSDEFAVIHRALADPQDREIRRLLKEHYVQYSKFLTVIIEEGQRRKLLRDDIPAEVASWHLIHHALGYLFTRPLEAGSKCYDFSVQLAIAALDGLLTKPRGYK